MLTLMPLVIISFMIAAIIMMIAAIMSEKSLKEREKMTPFECGFSPFKKSRKPFSLRFFMVTLIFLIFDIEVAILLPIGLFMKISDILLMMILVFIISLILLVGLLHEWKQGALTWS